MPSNSSKPISSYVTFDGYEFQRRPYDEILRVITSTERKNGNSIHLVAVSTLYAASNNQDLRKILSNGILVCDSTPIGFLINRLGEKLEVCRGTDYLRYVLENEANFGRHFFLGGTEETLKALQIRIQQDYPNVVIAGSFSPPFNDQDVIEKSLQYIKDCNPTYVWVGMGSPKQDFIAAELALRTGLTTFAVGAAFDFISQTIQEAPILIRKSGFEWLFRLALEPKRLWRRYIFGNFYFLRIAIRSIMIKVLSKNR